MKIKTSYLFHIAPHNTYVNIFVYDKVYRKKSIKLRYNFVPLLLSNFPPIGGGGGGRERGRRKLKKERGKNRERRNEPIWRITRTVERWKSRFSSGVNRLRASLRNVEFLMGYEFYSAPFLIIGGGKKSSFLNIWRNSE